MLIASSSFGGIHQHRPNSSSSLLANDDFCFTSSNGSVIPPGSISKNLSPEFSHGSQPSNQKNMSMKIPSTNDMDAVKINGMSTTIQSEVILSNNERNSNSPQNNCEETINLITKNIAEINSEDSQRKQTLQMIKIPTSIKGCKNKFKRGELSFRDLVDVVLIPSRNEFRAACCDLWWTRNDFMKNQQATIR